MGEARRKLNNKGFTILEVVIAILVIVGVSVATISTIMAVRSLSNGYYQRILAVNELESIGACIERNETGRTDGFIDLLYDYYGIETEDDAIVEVRSSDDVSAEYRVYFDEFMKPVKLSELDGGKAEFYCEILVEKGESQRILNCTVRSSETDTQVAGGLELQTAQINDETFSVVETVTINDDGEKETKYAISSSESAAATEKRWFLDDQLEYAILTERGPKSSVKNEADPNMDQDEVMRRLSRSFGLDGKLYGDVVVIRHIAAYRLAIFRTDEEKLVIKSENVIRRTLSETDADGGEIESGSFGDAVGKALGFAGGDGTEARPFVISTEQELLSMQRLSAGMRPVGQSISDFLVFDETDGKIYYYGSVLDFEVYDGGGVTFYKSLKSDGQSEGDEEEPSRVELVYCTMEDGVLSVDFAYSNVSEYLAADGVRLYRVVEDSGSEPKLLLDAAVQNKATAVSDLSDAESMSLRRGYYWFKLTEDINLEYSEGVVCENFCGVFDGGGHKITAGDSDVCLIGTASADSVIRNIELEESADKGLLTLLRTSGLTPEERRIIDKTTISTEAINVEPWSADEKDVLDDVLIENVNVNGMLRVDEGESAYLENARGRRTTFRNCKNYADILCLSGGSTAVYLSGSWDISAGLYFEGCKNFGTVFGESAALFVACGARGEREGTAAGGIGVLDSCSFGEIVGVNNAGYVYGADDWFAYEELFGSYTDAEGTTVNAVTPKKLTAYSPLYALGLEEENGNTLVMQFDGVKTEKQLPLPENIVISEKGGYTDKFGTFESVIVESGAVLAEKAGDEEAESFPSFTAEVVESETESFVRYTAKLKIARFIDAQTAAKLNDALKTAEETEAENPADANAEPENPDTAVIVRSGADMTGKLTYTVYDVFYTDKPEPEEATDTEDTTDTEGDVQPSDNDVQSTEPEPGTETEPAAELESHSERWYVFDMPDGVLMNYVAESTVIVLGAEREFVEIVDDDETIIGRDYRVIGFAK